MTDFETMLKNNENFNGTKINEEKLYKYNKLVETVSVIKKLPTVHVEAETVESTHPNCTVKVSVPSPAFLINQPVKEAFAEMFKLSDDVCIAQSGANTVFSFGVTGIWEE